MKIIQYTGDKAQKVSNILTFLQKLGIFLKAHSWAGMMWRPMTTTLDGTKVYTHMGKTINNLYVDIKQ
jgi:hypothetical protein